MTRSCTQNPSKSKSWTCKRARNRKNGDFKEGLKLRTLYSIGISSGVGVFFEPGIFLAL